MTPLAIDYGKNSIGFLLETKKRKALRITVKPDTSVFVSAPKGFSIDDIKQKVISKASWIIKQQEYFTTFFPRIISKTYSGGETHCYLGRQYRLKITRNKKSSVKLKGKFIYIYTSKPSSSAYNKRLLYSWYKEKALVRFRVILEKSMLKLAKYGINQPRMTLRLMKSRWGSCSFSKGAILLNVELIKAPIHGIEYVILHELCHLKYPKHNKQFYNFLRLVMPDWEKRKKRLEKTAL